jgi:hypothetical protein
VDWDFPRSTTPIENIHTLHWFPGNFIPQIPSFLIQALSSDGAMVCDPFCGSGTTGIEALRLGRNCLQSDVNRASVQVAAGKLAGFTSGSVAKSLGAVMDGLLLELRIPRSSRSWKHEDLEIPRSSLSLEQEGSDPELKRWLHPETYNQLGFLWNVVRSSSDIRPVLEMIFTDTLFACASVGGARTGGGKVRRHHWGWVADNVRPSKLIQHDAVDLFRNRLFRALRILSTERTGLNRTGSVRREDVRSLSLPTESVDLIVTSPPYLGMIDYTAANRLTYMWMGWPSSQDRELEIGARRYRHRSSAAQDYLDSMKVASNEMARILRPSGYCAVVIGASRKYPAAAQDLIKILATFFEIVWGPTARTPTRRRVSVKGAGDSMEFVCVFKK